ncbi:alpha/beta hydrolase [Listeria grandensis]|uniref:alpha/beta hydrolase n=1 Tax=Listeria grandensis TaxID=1494963 RepID=UPI00164DCB3E|nr:alpha/beta hydrolase [Listeria grandensis]MBC6316067.1 alpha/beta hydrolase [Listeria grandensis]
MKKILVSLLMLSLILAGCGPSKASEKELQNLPNLSSQTALVLVHGTGGGTGTFDGFSSTFIDKYKVSNQRISLKISTDGKLNYYGTLTKNAQHPIIQIGFEDSIDATITQQADWLRIALKDVANRYGFTKFDGVGHSNGGLVLSTYAQKYAKATPELKRLVAIGSPFNDLESDDNAGDLTFDDVPKTTPLLRTYEDNSSKISPDLLVLSIAGDVDDDSFSDDIVPVLSALGSRLIFKGHSKVYLESYYKGEEYDHRTMFANPDIQKKVAWFLYDYPGNKKEIQLAKNE